MYSRTDTSPLVWSGWLFLFQKDALFLFPSLQLSPSLTIKRNTHINKWRLRFHTHRDNETETWRTVTGFVCFVWLLVFYLWKHICLPPCRQYVMNSCEFHKLCKATFYTRWPFTSPSVCTRHQMAALVAHLENWKCLLFRVVGSNLSILVSKLDSISAGHVDDRGSIPWLGGKQL